MSWQVLYPMSFYGRRVPQTIYSPSIGEYDLTLSKYLRFKYDLRRRTSVIDSAAYPAVHFMAMC